MTFEIVAKQIIKDSIRSAVCLDDEYAEAYSERKDLKIDEPKELYSSFRSNGHCDLDIYNFETLEKSWYGKEYILANKDLLVLDWQLDSGKGFDSTLKILRDVIDAGKIPFVVVYTNEENLDGVANSIVDEFPTHSQKARSGFEKKFNAGFSYLTDDADMSLDSIADDLSKSAFEYINHINKRAGENSQVFKDFLKLWKVKSEMTSKAKSKFDAIVTNNIPSDDPLLSFCHSICAWNTNDVLQHNVSRIDANDLAYKVGGTIVIILRKKDQNDGILPEDLFSKFSDLITKNPHTFLSLLAIELKDGLREEFAAIGNRFIQINERAFLYHANNYRNQESNQINIDRVQDFVLNNWISEVYQKMFDSKSKLLPFIEEKVKEFLSTGHNDVDEQLISDLTEYCYYSTTVEIDNRVSTTLKFGDTFACDGQNELYFMCITPHCDLVNPKEKLNDNYYFVKGVKQKDLDKALRDVDTDYYSFAKHLDEVIAIRWICKPITFYLPDVNISDIRISYTGKEYRLEHCALAKENIVQRIANQSFGYGHRVGIDVPYLESS